MIAGGQILDNMCRQHFLCEVADYLYYFSPVHVQSIRKTAEVCTIHSVCYIYTRTTWTGTMWDVIIISSYVLVPCLFLFYFFFYVFFFVFFRVVSVTGVDVVWHCICTERNISTRWPVKPAWLVILAWTIILCLFFLFDSFPFVFVRPFVFHLLSFKVCVL